MHGKKPTRLMLKLPFKFDFSSSPAIVSIPPGVVTQIVVLENVPKKINFELQIYDSVCCCLLMRFCG
jgi:hypothetical protein